jgi:hypothetical protein
VLNCREVTEKASDFHGGGLGWRDLLQLRLHVLMCRHCSRYLDQLGSVIRLIRSIPRNQPASEVEAELKKVFRSEFSDQSGRTQGPNS